MPEALHIIDVATQSVTHVLNIFSGATPNRVLFSRDGTWLACTDNEGMM